MYNPMLGKHFLVSSLSHDFTAERESSAVLDRGKKIVFHCYISCFDAWLLLSEITYYCMAVKYR